MLNISPSLWKDLAEQAHENVVREVMRGIRALCPETCVGRSEIELREQAKQLVGQAQHWNIQTAANILRLLDFRLRWGPLIGAESHWVIDVLQGPLDESDKLDYLHEVLNGD